MYQTRQIGQTGQTFPSQISQTDNTFTNFLANINSELTMKIPLVDVIFVYLLNLNKFSKSIYCF